MIAVAEVCVSIVSPGSLVRYTNYTQIGSPSIVCSSIRASTGWPFTLTNTRFRWSCSLIATWAVCLIFFYDLIVPTGCWSCICCTAVLIAYMLIRFMHSSTLCPASPYHEPRLSRTRPIPSFCNKVLWILFYPKSFIPADAVDRAPVVASRFCSRWPLSGLGCYVGLLEWVLVAWVYLDTIL